MLNDEVINNEQLTNDDVKIQLMKDKDELLLDAQKEDQQQPISQSMTRYHDEEDEDDNSISNSRSSDIECGPAFSSSMSSRDNDSPRLFKRQPTNSGDNYSFEFIEREIGMCRPVCSISLIENKPFLFFLSLKMVYVKYMF
jgi:hypothetical protein